MKDNILKAKRIILVVSGGIGRNIFATAVVRNLKKTYPNHDIIVCCGCPEVFQNNPHIKRIYSFDKPQHLFEDYIFDNKDTVILDVEPYRHPDYLSGNRHIVECWCDLLEISCDSIKPELYFVKNEKEVSKAYMTKYKKPVILIQHTGGKVPEQPTAEARLTAKDAMYRRGLPEDVVQELTDKFIADGYIVGSVQHPNQFQPKGSELIHFPLRATLGLIPYVEGIISIDSMLQHASAAFDVPSLVCWAGTNPEKLGYTLHTNLRKKVCPIPECHRPNSYAFDIQPNGMMWNCPYSEECCNYTADEIYEAYKTMKGDRYLEMSKKGKDIPDEKKYEAVSCTTCKET
jgi:ADP-heptose:LPS heptosyltransferase